MKKSRRTYNGVHLTKKSNVQDVVEQSLTILLCHYVILKLGRSVRVPMGRSVPVMAAHSVPVSLSSDNAVSRSCRSDLMPAGDNRMSVCKHGGA